MKALIIQYSLKSLPCLWPPPPICRASLERGSCDIFLTLNQYLWNVQRQLIIKIVGS